MQEIAENNEEVQELNAAESVNSETEVLQEKQEEQTQNETQSFEGEREEEYDAEKIKKLIHAQKSAEGRTAGLQRQNADLEKENKLLRKQLAEFQAFNMKEEANTNNKKFDEMLDNAATSLSEQYPEMNKEFTRDIMKNATSLMRTHNENAQLNQFKQVGAALSIRNHLTTDGQTLLGNIDSFKRNDKFKKWVEETPDAYNNLMTLYTSNDVDSVLDSANKMNKLLLSCPVFNEQQEVKEEEVNAPSRGISASGEQKTKVMSLQEKLAKQSELMRNLFRERNPEKRLALKKEYDDITASIVTKKT